MRASGIWPGTILAIVATSLIAVAFAAAIEGPQAEAPSQVSATSLPRSEALEAAALVDRLVDSNLRRQNLEPNAPIDDATFVRRAYLDVIGRIPTAAETERFLKSPSPEKRAELIDLLLDSPGYTSHLFNYFADVLRVKTRLARQINGAPYIHFLKASLAGNKPYDQLVSELLTAEGPAHARDNGATGYYLRDREMPEDNMANTVRVFLGTRIECAQCHDHPFDRWTQKQFFEMVAFTGGLRYRNQDLRSPEGRELIRYGRELRQESPAAYRAYRRTITQLGNAILGTGTGLARLPKDYAYDNARPNELVTAHTLFGVDPELDVPVPQRDDRRNRRRRPRNERQFQLRDAQMPEVGSRDAYAQWLTSPANPRFTKVIVNRLWKRFFGLGLIEPVDDLKDDTRASNPLLLDQLEKLMVELDYDLKQFQRVLLNTEAYQRAASTSEPAEEEVYHFPGPLLRRMSAEQMWDSLLTLVVSDVDATIGDPGEEAERIYAEYEAVADLSTEELIAHIDAEARSGRGRMRNRMMAADAQDRREQLAEEQAKRRAARPLYRQLRRARRQGNVEAEERIVAKLRELGLDPDPRRQRGRSARNLRRASELESPAPAGHLLQQFGQSDREQIEAAHRDANVPQVLTLLNGFLEKEVLRDARSALRLAIDRASSKTAKIEAIYLAALNRLPERRELALWKHDADRFGDEALLDLAWTLVNSHEFRFIQ